jgi:hypothetical protein
MTKEIHMSSEYKHPRAASLFSIGVAPFAAPGLISSPSRIEQNAPAASCRHKKHLIRRNRRLKPDPAADVLTCLPC